MSYSKPSAVKICTQSTQRLWQIPYSLSLSEPIHTGLVFVILFLNPDSFSKLLSDVKVFQRFFVEGWRNNEVVKFFLLHYT